MVKLLRWVLKKQTRGNTMNQGQEKFFSFIMERIAKEHEETAKALLSENFAKQQAGTFTQEDVVAFQQKMLSLLRPECVEEVKAITQNYRA